MSESRPTISTHVLDTATGQPAVGVRIVLERVATDGAAETLADARTDDDGRIRDLLAGQALVAGRYRLTFETSRDRPDVFFVRASVEVDIGDVGRSYHVPLLLAPFGLTTYRGS